MVWIWNGWVQGTTDPEEDLAIHNVSVGGRDDFRHAGVRLGNQQVIFHFGLGRPFERELTPEERSAYPQYDNACVFLIKDRDLAPEQRQAVQEWLQAREDGIVAALRASGKDRKHQMMCLRSVDHIEGY